MKRFLLKLIGPLFFGIIMAVVFPKTTTIQGFSLLGIYLVGYIDGRIIAPLVDGKKL